MAKRRNRVYDSWFCVKARQGKAKKLQDIVDDYEIDDYYLNSRRAVLNKRRRSKVGYTEKRNGS